MPNPTPAPSSQPTPAAPSSSEGTPAPKPAEPAAPAPATPTQSATSSTTPEGAPSVDEGYDLELAAESPLTQEDLDEIAAEASRLNLKKEDALKLITMREATYTKAVNAHKTTLEAEQNKAVQAFQSDPDFSGDNGKKSWESVGRVIEAFGNDDVKAILSQPTHGNNIHLARMLKKIGEHMAPDTIHNNAGGPRVGAPQQDDPETARLKRMYPSHFEEKK